MVTLQIHSSRWTSQATEWTDHLSINILLNQSLTRLCCYDQQRNRREEPWDSSLCIIGPSTRWGWFFTVVAPITDSQNESWRCSCYIDKKCMCDNNGSDSTKENWIKAIRQTLRHDFTVWRWSTRPLCLPCKSKENAAKLLSVYRKNSY